MKEKKAQKAQKWERNWLTNCDNLKGMAHRARQWEEDWFTNQRETETVGDGVKETHIFSVPQHCFVAKQFNKTFFCPDTLKMLCFVNYALGAEKKWLKVRWEPIPHFVPLCSWVRKEKNKHFLTFHKTIRIQDILTDHGIYLLTYSTKRKCCVALWSEKEKLEHLWC